RIVVEAPRGPLALGPDNGLLTPVLVRKGAVAREITNPRWFIRDDTRTFEGRSRFAPAAATLAPGAGPAGAGPIVTDPVVLDLARSHHTRGGVAGEVVYVDSFGNLVTSVPASDLHGLGGRSGLVVSLGGRRTVPLKSTYADVAAGRPVAYV